MYDDITRFLDLLQTAIIPIYIWLTRAQTLASHEVSFVARGRQSKNGHARTISGLRHHDEGGR